MIKKNYLELYIYEMVFLVLLLWMDYMINDINEWARNKVVDPFEYDFKII